MKELRKNSTISETSPIMHSPVRWKPNRHIPKFTTPKKGPLSFSGEV
jgi:hypothetical protein